ncbi:efflux RND transporter periplasmic adaptor subunit [Neptunomonas qingdaonensis]|uniref:Barrel-sandwich domain of CusB or HlyD membrane-fusion n=1 Tax=Neptunomonas qingdaonensis TaxID=1045558 RepID=A0A1I2UAI1_9GAMM|nr:HlyD family efflux transporter periplasmic adaptor subunit [Neptunomonas qingdaonensis]SFG72687.1 Barrel-sandwich domain of CusB or HlyD membrane-fusion [Neptunomonas qingdaonensis]
MPTVVNKPATRRLTWILPILALAVAVVIFISLKNSKPQAPARAVVEKLWSVQIQPVVFAAYSPEIVLYGQVESPQMTQISAPVTAFVEQVLSREGQSVSQDELLIKLDPRDMQLILRQREADLQSIDARISAAQIQYTADQTALSIEKKLYALANKSVSRYRDLSKRNVSSQDQLDTAQISLQQQALSLNNREQAISAFPAQLSQLKAEQEKIRALRDTALLDLQRTSIKAPFTARIAKITTATGDRVKSGDPLITLYEPGALQLRSQVPSKILPWIRQGLNENQPLNATAMIDKQHISLRLSHLASSVTNGKTGVDAFLEFDSEQFIPEPGRTLSLTLTLPKIDNIIGITPRALYGTDRVYRVTEGQLEAVVVTKVGNAHDSNGEPLVLLQSDKLQAEDQVIITQLPNAITGLPVKITE